MATTFFQTTFTTINSNLANHIVNSTTQLASILTPIFHSMLVIWITIWGYQAMMGRADGMLQESFYRILKIAFIISFALNAPNFNNTIVPFLQGIPETIASTITGSATSSISVTLDNFADKFISLGNIAWKKAGYTAPGYYLIAGTIYGFGGFLVVMLAVLILMSKVVITLLLAIGPIFIIATLFQPTQRFFDSWIGVLMNASFTLILSASLGSAFLNISQNYINTITNPTVNNTIGLVFLFSMLIAVVNQITGIAASLGGGFAMSTSGMIRRFTNNIKTGANHLKKGGRAIGSTLNHLDKLPGHLQNLKGKPQQLESRFRESNRISSAVYRRFNPNRISGN